MLMYHLQKYPIRMPKLGTDGRNLHNASFWQSDAILLPLKQPTNIMEHKKLTPVEIKRLQNKVRSLEARIIHLAWPDRSDSVMASVAELCENERKAERLGSLLQERCICLNNLFRATADEYERLSAINDRLRDLTSKMKDRAEGLLCAIISSDPEWLRDSRLELELIPQVPSLYTVSRADGFYNSDFNTIINIECAYMLVNGNNVASNLYCDGEFSCGVAELDSEIDDWKEARLLWMDESKEIKWCWALHQLEDHLRFPFIDIIQLKDFQTHLTLDSYGGKLFL